MQRPAAPRFPSRPALRGFGRCARAWALSALAWCGIAAAAEDAASDEALEDLARSAYAESPELRAAHARWRAALERVPQAGSLPDPTLGYGYFVERMSARQQFRLEQMLPGFGKRAARTSVAEAEAEAAARALEATAADLRQQVFEAAANYLLAHQALGLIDENLRLVESLGSVASQRYRAGDGSQADLLRLENEGDLLRLERQSWQEREAPLRARLNALIGRASDAPLPPLGPLPQPPVPPSAELDRGSPDLAANPDLQEAEAAIRAAEQARELARREGRPDLMVGVEVMDNLDQAPNEVMGMISVSLPVWQGRYRAARREAEAALDSARAAYRSRLRSLESAGSLALFEWRDARRRLQLFEETLLPRARQTLNVLEAGYRAGSAAFLDLLEAQRSLLDLELNALRAQTDVYVRSLEWERLTAASQTHATALAPSAER